MCNRKNYQFIGLKGIFFRLIFSPKFYYGRHVESILFPGVSDIENVEINYWAKIENLIIERKLRIFKRFLVRIFRMIKNFFEEIIALNRYFFIYCFPNFLISFSEFCIIAGIHRSLINAEKCFKLDFKLKYLNLNVTLCSESFPDFNIQNILNSINKLIKKTFSILSSKEQEIIFFTIVTVGKSWQKKNSKWLFRQPTAGGNLSSGLNLSISIIYFFFIWSN